MKSMTVLFIQITISVLILASAYALKSFGGEIYNTVRNFYYDNLNSSITMPVNAPTVESYEIQN